MAHLITPWKQKAQPQHSVFMNSNLPMFLWGLVHVPEVIRGTKYPGYPAINANILQTVGSVGKAYQWVNTKGAGAGETITYNYTTLRDNFGIIVIKRTNTSGGYVIYNGGDSLVIYCTDSNGTTTIEWCGTATGISISNALPIGQISNVVWCYNYATSSLRLAINGALASATKSWNLANGSPRPGLGQYAESGPLEMYLLAVSNNTVVSDTMMISLSKNPWQIFSEDTRVKYFLPPAATAGATRWIGGDAGGTTDWEIAANWSDGVPTSSKDAIFESSAYACTLTAAATAKSLNIMPKYSATFATSGYALDLYGNLYLNSNGVVTIDNTITMKASASITTNRNTISNLTHSIGTLSLVDVLTCSGTFKIKPDVNESVTFKTNGRNFSAATFTVDQS